MFLEPNNRSPGNLATEHSKCNPTPLLISDTYSRSSETHTSKNFNIVGFVEMQLNQFTDTKTNWHNLNNKKSIEKTLLHVVEMDSYAKTNGAIATTK